MMCLACRFCPLLVLFSNSRVLQQFLNEVDVGEQHTTAAVAVQADFVQRFAAVGNQKECVFVSEWV